MCILWTVEHVSASLSFRFLLRFSPGAERKGKPSNVQGFKALEGSLFLQLGLAFYLTRTGSGAAFVAVNENSFR